MNLHIISWNVRGLNDWEKRRRVHNSLRMWKGDVVCLQETKMESISTGVVRSIWGSPFVGWGWRRKKWNGR